MVGADEVVSAFMKSTFGLNERSRPVAALACSTSQKMARANSSPVSGSSRSTARTSRCTSRPSRSRWMTKELLWYTFYYPFVECGVKRVTGLVEETNQHAQRFDERIGFNLEARLKDAAPDGDLLVYAMFRDECRWLKLRDRIPHLKAQVN